MRWSKLRQHWLTSLVGKPQVDLRSQILSKIQYTFSKTHFRVSQFEILSEFFSKMFKSTPNQSVLSFNLQLQPTSANFNFNATDLVAKRLRSSRPRASSKAQEPHKETTMAATIQAPQMAKVRAFAEGRNRPGPWSQKNPKKAVGFKMLQNVVKDVWPLKTKNGLKMKWWNLMLMEWKMFKMGLDVDMEYDAEILFGGRYTNLKKWVPKSEIIMPNIALSQSPQNASKLSGNLGSEGSVHRLGEDHQQLIHGFDVLAHVHLGGRYRHQHGAHHSLILDRHTAWVPIFDEISRSQKFTSTDTSSKKNSIISISEQTYPKSNWVDLSQQNISSSASKSHRPNHIGLRSSPVWGPIRFRCRSARWERCLCQSLLTLFSL